jgi:hypothetical protein
MVSDLPTHGAVGTKRNAKDHMTSRIGYKFDLDVLGSSTMWRNGRMRRCRQRRCADGAARSGNLGLGRVRNKGPLKFHWGDKGHQLPPISFFMGMDGMLGVRRLFAAREAGTAAGRIGTVTVTATPCNRRTSPQRVLSSGHRERHGSNPRQDDRRHDDGAAVARISHTIGRIGAPNQPKSLCCSDIEMIRGNPDPDRA